jgi:alkylation response protein AidB-like acyl-CoA dehydrogenase
MSTTTATSAIGAPRITELPTEMLAQFRARAGDLDRTNTYFDEDLAELREAGDLAAAVPVHLGGWGLDLAEMVARQRRLAHYAPATALAMTMHSYWVGMAAELERSGDTSLRWLLEAAVAGEVIAAGHAESGNDIPVLLSTARAERVEGGYRLTGRKQFGSNGPAWTWLGAHAIDPDAPGGPQTVHAFVERRSPGVSVVETWDTLGMRGDPEPRHSPGQRVCPGRPHRTGGARRRRQRPVHRVDRDVATVADRGCVPRHRRACPGAGGARRTPQEVDRHRPRVLRLQPFVQHQIAETYLELDAASATLERFVVDWVAQVDHRDAWVPKVYSTKWPAVEAAKRVVDIALDVVGGADMFRSNELERLYRDVRCGGFHPGNDALAHEMIGKAVLGIITEQPRW